MILRNVKFRIRGVERRHNVRVADRSQLREVLAAQFGCQPPEVELLNEPSEAVPPLRRLRVLRDSERGANRAISDRSPPSEPIDLGRLDLSAELAAKLTANGLDSVQKVVSHLDQHGSLVGLKGIGKTSDEAIRAAVLKLVNGPAAPPAA